MKKKNVFRKWLDKKGLTYQQFIDQVNSKSLRPTLKYRTVIGWSQFDRIPRDSNQAEVVSVFPDFPLLTGNFSSTPK